MPNSCDFSLLNHNLEVLRQHTAWSIFANESNTKLYSTHSLYGRILYIWLKVREWFFGNSQENLSVFDVVHEQLSAAIDELGSLELKPEDLVNAPTERAQRIVHIGNLCRYFTNLGEKSVKKIFPEQSSLCAVLPRVEIMDGSRTLLRHESHSQVFRIQKLLNHKAKIIRRFAKSYATAAVCSTLELGYPLPLFKKLSRAGTIRVSEKEERLLKEWIDCVVSNQDRLSVRVVHHALKGVVKCFCSEDKILRKKALETLEFRLAELGCSILLKEDPLYAEWARNLEGTTVELRQGKHKFSLPVNSSNFDKQHKQFFLYHEDRGANPAQYLLVGSNPVILSIWKQFCKKAFCILPVEVLDEDRHNHYYLLQSELGILLSSYDWGRYTESDQMVINELVKVIKWLARHPHTPCMLSCDTIFVRCNVEEVVLRTIMPISEGMTHNFLAIEKFAQDCARGYSDVLNALIRLSDLKQHPVAKAIHEIVERELHERQRLSIQNEVYNKGISDQSVIEAITTMVRDLKDRQMELVNLLQPRLRSHEDLPRLKSLLATSLLELQRASSYSSQIFQDYDQDEFLIRFMEEQRVLF